MQVIMIMIPIIIQVCKWIMIYRTAILILIHILGFILRESDNIFSNIIDNEYNVMYDINSSFNMNANNNS